MDEGQDRPHRDTFGVIAPPGCWADFRALTEAPYVTLFVRFIPVDGGWAIGGNHFTTRCCGAGESPPIGLGLPVGGPALDSSVTSFFRGYPMRDVGYVLTGLQLLLEGAPYGVRDRAIQDVAARDGELIATDSRLMVLSLHAFLMSMRIEISIDGDSCLWFMEPPQVAGLDLADLVEPGGAPIPWLREQPPASERTGLRGAVVHLHNPVLIPDESSGDPQMPISFTRTCSVQVPYTAVPQEAQAGLLGGYVQRIRVRLLGHLLDRRSTRVAGLAKMLHTTVDVAEKIIERVNARSPEFIDGLATEAGAPVESVRIALRHLERIRSVDR